MSFGGIIGLFLGGSLISAIELMYYLLVALFSYLASCLATAKQETGNRGMILPSRRDDPPSFLALPIPDYGPLKTRSRRFPILVNYTPVKSNLNRY